MFANYLIGLREGLEAALIVGILAAYLTKLGQGKQIPKILYGVAAAVLLCVGAGLVLWQIESTLPKGTEEAIAGITSIVAVVFVTWMIFWMARESRKLGGSLRSKIDAAVQGSIWSLSFVAFFAVIREGIETSVLLWSATKSVGSDGSPAWGAFLGLATAAVLGYLLYRGSLKVNLGVFFKYTGAYLIVVAAGILSYGIHELQEIGWLNLLPHKAYDLSVAIPDGSVLHAVLKGVLAFDTAPTLLQALAWFAYLIPVAVIYWRASFGKVAK